MFKKLSFYIFPAIIIPLTNMLLGISSLTYAQKGWHTSTETSILDIYPNYNSLSLELSYKGDDDGDNNAHFVYRRLGDENWRNGVDVTPFRESKLWRASIFPLSPGETYEITVTVEDDDGVTGNKIKMAARTRPLITENKNGMKYYVSTVGSDNNPGTKEKPFKSINRAINEVRAGGEVIVAPGIYKEMVVLENITGTPEAPVVIKSEKEHKAVLDGSVGLPSGSKWNKIESDIYSTNLHWNPNYINMDGLRMYLHRSMKELRSDPSNVKRCFYYDSENKKLFVRTGKNDNPEKHRFLLSNLDEGFIFNSVSYVVVKGFEIRNHGTAGVSIVGNSDCNAVINNIIHHAPYGVSIRSEWADNNAVWFNNIWEEGLGDFSWRAVKASGYPRQGISCRGGRGNSMVGNTVHGWFDCITAGAWGRLEECHINRDVEIMYNDLFNAGDDALEPEGCHINLKIHGNRIRNVLSAISLAPIGTGPAYITYNEATFYLLFFKMNVGGSLSTGHCYCYHNTGYPIVPDKGTGFSFTYGIPLKNKIFRNNIVVTGSRLVRSGPKGNSVDYNCYYLTGGDDASAFEWERKMYRNIDDFRKATGNEINGFYSDPLLVRPSLRKNVSFDDYRVYHNTQNPLLDGVNIGDFRLRTDSPCIDTGILIRGVNEDFMGKATDIGTYEKGTEKKLGTSFFNAK